jgi:leucyl aminopeptidase
MARDLVNEPPNYLLPEPYAKLISEELKSLGVKVEILDKKKMEKLGMGAALGVAQGSDNPPCMVVMTWDGRKKKNKSDKPLAYVGKGVTFDTGGISLKPGKGMGDMKMDMGGSAAVVGAMKSLALRKADAYAVGIVGLVENMPSGKAYRPADVLTSLSGKTIEVLNTDAEGRLVLADALTYVQDTYDPKLIVDLATLTGAILVALAHEYAGTFVNNDALWAQMETASTETGEKLWRMPLDKTWNEAVKSPTADIQNLSSIGAYGGSCTAAAFLEYFIDEGRSWAHIDIAGTAWNPKDKPTGPKFGTGFGVRVLDHLATNADT